MKDPLTVLKKSQYFLFEMSKDPRNNKLSKRQLRLAYDVLKIAFETIKEIQRRQKEVEYYETSTSDNLGVSDDFGT